MLVVSTKGCSYDRHQSIEITFQFSEYSYITYAWLEYCQFARHQQKWSDTEIPDTPQFSVPQEMKFPQLHSTNEVGNARS